MAQQRAYIDVVENSVSPEIRTITFADLRDAVRSGLDDFNAFPSHGAFLVVIFPAVGLVLWGLSVGANLLHLVYPMIAGFALLGPIAAIGIYELSRRREQRLPVSWTNILDILHSPSIGAIAILSFFLFLIFAAWIGTAEFIYAANFGSAVPSSIVDLVTQVFTTASGRRLLIVGTAAGFVFAVVSFAMGVVSFPLLLDRQVGAPTAVATSIRVVSKNPVTMAAWGFFIAASMAMGSLLFLFGLTVVLPVLGHASWHLYRKVVSWTPTT